MVRNCSASYSLVPVLVLERRVPHELALDHEHLDVVDGVHIVHRVDHHLADLGPGRHSIHLNRVTNQVAD